MQTLVIWNLGGGDLMLRVVDDEASRQLLAFRDDALNARQFQQAVGDYFAENEVDLHSPNNPLGHKGIPHVVDTACVQSPVSEAFAFQADRVLYFDDF
ncbi:MAG: hypothetical protein ACXAC5_02195 [Promethearchaeota archaeon]|jgi:hypothetical protein